MRDLVGQGKPFHSAIDKAAGLLKRKVGTGAEFMKELQALGGVKQAEIDDRKLGELMGMPKMTHEQFVAELGNRPVPTIREKVLGGDPDDPNWIGPYHYQYSLPGGENYREMLIKAPKPEGYSEKLMELEAKLRRAPPDQAAHYIALVNKYKKLASQNEQFPGDSRHFGGEPGILASMRVKDRTGPNGEKLLHLEELQSDWHQQGRDRGYKGDFEPEAEMLKKRDDLYDARTALVKEALAIEKAGGLAPQELIDRIHGMNDQLRTIEERKDKARNAIPDAPFKKNWEEMALKRLIHHAAEKGYHGIVVTPGAEQADRYSLAKHIDALHYNPDTHRLIGKKNGMMLIDEVAVSPEKLESYVGKEAAQKVMSQKPNVNGLRSLLGEDLQVGGEGMKGFYDKKVPNILNAIGKKHGVKTQLHGHKLGDIPDLPEDHEPEDVESHAKMAGTPLHYFPITEDMRKDILTNGLPLYAEGGTIHKAEGGKVQPTPAQMKLALMKANPLNIQSIGANEAPDMSPKAYMPPDIQTGNFVPPGGARTPAPMNAGGVDMSRQPGQQLVPQGLPQQGQQQPPQPMGGLSQPQPPAQQPQAPAGMNGNILEMTPAGRALNALSPNQPGMADGGSVKDENSGKRMLIKGEGPGGVKGIMVPRHMWHGKQGVFKKGAKKGQKFKIEGMSDINKARAKVYGAENRDPLNIGQIGRIHEQTLNEHFKKSPEEQMKAEVEALQRLREAKHIGHDSNTLDESEKLDTVRHEKDEEGRTHVGYASKGVAGRAVYTSGYGQHAKHHIINTCPGQTEGCGGGLDKDGIADTSKGTCFAPNAESQYVNAAVRRACHEQAKHDPAMTRDWILAHTGSLRHAANLADKNNQRTLFRPNVVDETDTSSRHVIKGLNEQREKEGKPSIIANSYGKTNELHDPENGYYVTHSNVGPKVKHGQEVTENIGRDNARVQNTIKAANKKGEDFKNEQGNLTPPKGSYLVTNVKRGSPMAKKMEEHISHAKYWSRGREEHELSAEEKEEGPEGHFGPNGKPTTPEKAHFGHTTLNGRRYDYQKQHILHPRLVNVPARKKNKKTGEMENVEHMIPTDSRFKDTEFLPKNRFKSKNGKEAGHILMTTPTESTSNLEHHTPFTHDVNQKHIEHAMANKGEYEIDNPHDQEKARGKEYVMPQPIKIVRKAMGGMVNESRHPGYEDDDFHAFPEQNIAAMRHLALRRGEDEEVHYKSKHKKPVAMHKNMDTMRLEMMRKK